MLLEDGNVEVDERDDCAVVLSTAIDVAAGARVCRSYRDKSNEASS